MILKYVLLLGTGQVITKTSQSVINVLVGLIYTSFCEVFFFKLLEVSPSACPKLCLSRTNMFMPHVMLYCFSSLH